MNNWQNHYVAYTVPQKLCNNSVVMEVIMYRAEDPAKYYGADEDVIELQITNK